MSQIPSAIVFINKDTSDNVKNTLIKQLYIHESMSGEEFDNRLSVDPEYINIVHLNGLRILVTKDFWAPRTGFELADVVIFIKMGLAYVEQNNLGPPTLTLPVDTLYIHALLRGNGKIT